MQVSILGSCSVIRFPDDVDAFFNGDNLIDIRNGFRMEMDALPLYFLAIHTKDKSLVARLSKGIASNLRDSGVGLWVCGVWGCDEIHLRFVSCALRFMLLNPQDFSYEQTHRSILQHLSHHESVMGGKWFYHDSIETNGQSYYPTWSGVHMRDVSQKNMLILNTHIDTLVTILIARHLGFNFGNEWLEKGLCALNGYFDEGELLQGFKLKVDQIFRGVLLFVDCREGIIAGLCCRVLKHFYYSKVRMYFRRRKNIRGAKDGFTERDIRLPGSNFEYHVVNLWDISRLLLWMRYTKTTDIVLEKKLMKTLESGLHYCASSSIYTNYIKRISLKKGVSNELLEAIAASCSLGLQHSWLVKLYFEWREFSPPSVGIMGIDNILSGVDIPDNEIIYSESVDWIPFSGGQIFIACRESSGLSLSKERFRVIWSSSDVLSDEDNICIPVLSISLVALREE